METPTRKRFYKEAGIFEDAGGFGVALDGKPVKTPAGAEFRVPSRCLAKACANEWAAQSERIVPASMPLTQFAFAALDHTPGRREELVTHVAKYAETDLCSYRADQPAALAARQSAAWDPLLSWARAELKLDLPVVTGVIAADVDPATIETLKQMTRALDDFRLTVLAHAAGLSGSALIGLAITHGVLDGAHAYDAAVVDEHWSLERWGEDAGARLRLDNMRVEFETVARLIAALT